MTTEAYNNPGKELLRRYEDTLKFIDKVEITKNMPILDLGTENPFTKILKNKGFNICNSGKIDLDRNPKLTPEMDVEVVTALEILEHLVSPYPLLKNLPGKKLIATVPLKLWFAKAYRNPNDEWDQHYHEFEDWQFDWLLEKSGWKILYKEKWIAPSGKIGFRPFLRRITPRYYAVYAERIR